MKRWHLCGPEDREDQGYLNITVIVYCRYPCKDYDLVVLFTNDTIMAVTKQLRKRCKLSVSVLIVKNDE